MSGLEYSEKEKENKLYILNFIKPEISSNLGNTAKCSNICQFSLVGPILKTITKELLADIKIVRKMNIIDEFGIYEN